MVRDRRLRGRQRKGICMPKFWRRFGDLREPCTTNDGSRLHENDGNARDEEFAVALNECYDGL
jgi:hypothetical protein